MNFLNVDATLELSTKGNYQRYLEWGRKNGVLMNEVLMPAAFGALGIPGVAATTDIPANRVILIQIIVGYHRRSIQYHHLVGEGQGQSPIRGL